MTPGELRYEALRRTIEKQDAMPPDRARLKAIKERATHPAYQVDKDIPWLVERLEEVLETAQNVLDFAWDELTEGGKDGTVPVPHWCGFTQNPESGYCSTHEGIGMLQKLRDLLSRFEWHK